jgi:trans-2,3-dihydro-3-hydroxyanthranilate isomerase
VVFDAEGLDDAAMRAIAAEFNLSETTFVLPAQSDRGTIARPHVRFRWFTPTVEVDMCGHATVAGIHALIESGRVT